MSFGRLAKTRPGEMRHRIQVKYRTTTPDDIGGLTEAWAYRFKNEPAKYQDVSGGEFLRGRKIDVTTTAIFTVNYRDGYLETDLIEWDGLTWGIVSIDKPEGIGRFYEIQAKIAE